MGLRMKNFSIMGVHQKIRFLEGCMKNQYIEVELPKKGGLDSFQISQGPWQNRGGDVI